MSNATLTTPSFAEHAISSRREHQGAGTTIGLTFTPDIFACGVDIVGPSSLNTLLSSIPPYWAPMFETFGARRVGDPRTEEGKSYSTTAHRSAA